MIAVIFPSMEEIRMSDFMRTHLVIKFVCAVCGEPLTLSYKDRKGSKCVDGEPTGAAMVESLVGVHPCGKCLAPAKIAKEAVRALLEIK